MLYFWTICSDCGVRPLALLSTFLLVVCPPTLQSFGSFWAASYSLKSNTENNLVFSQSLLLLIFLSLNSALRPRMLEHHCFVGPSRLHFYFLLALGLLRQGGNCSVEVTCELYKMNHFSRAPEYHVVNYFYCTECHPGILDSHV